MIIIIKTKKLDNGIRVVYEKLPFVSSVSLGIWVGNGSRYENDDTNGISHFIEHMLFKGTKERTAKIIASEIDEIGGQINAFTSKERTCYYTTTLKEYFDISLDVLQDIFLNSLFKDNDIEKEREVILEEISMYKDVPDDLVHEQLQTEIFNKKGLGYTILGTEKTLEKFDHDIIADYYNKNYHHDNVVISVAGNFDEDKVLEKIENKFSVWKRTTDFLRNTEKATYHPSFIQTEKDVEQLNITMAFKGYGKNDDKRYPLSIISNILGKGMSSRLFQTIREEHGLAYSIYTYTNSYEDIGTFSIYAGLSPDKAEKTIKLIKDELRIIRKERITKDELEKTKINIKSSILLSLESSQNIMASMGGSLLSKNKIVTPDDVAKDIDNISIEQINNVLDEVIDFDKLSLSVVGKLLDKDFEEIAKNV